MRSLMLPRGLGKVQTPCSLCCSPFSMPEINGIVPAGAEPEIKYSLIFLSCVVLGGRKNSGEQEREDANQC